MTRVYTVNKRVHPRDLVIAAAERILRSEGIGAVTTRRIASELGVTPMALYRHFEGKDALVEALVASGFARWEARLARAVRPGTPARRLRGALAAYRDFALEEPRLFELMFLLPRPGVPEAPGSLRSTVSPAFAEVIASVKDAIRAGDLPSTDPEEVVLMIWALAHGLVALHFSGRFGFQDELFRRAYDRTTAALWKQLRGRGASTP